MTYSEIVSKIKRVLEDPEGFSEPELQDLSQTFSRSCKIVDAGLARANVCLQSGQLCETYRLMKAEHFLEDSMTLMFAEFDEWQEICRILGLEPPIPISREASANLFVFDLEFEKVNAQYARYRRLELERASATKRLDSMYRIKEGLPNYCEFLRRDITMLEKQFEEEARGVLSKMTPELALTTDLERIFSNLTSPHRETPAPNDMVEAARQWREYAANVTTLRQLEDFVGRWRRASSDEECMRYNAEFERSRAYYQGALSIAPADLTQEISSLISQAQFIEHSAIANNVFRQKLGKLTSAASRRAGVDELANLLEEAELAADAAGTSIPPDVREEVEGRMHSIVAQKRRKRVAIISAIVLLVGFFSFLIVKTTANSARTRAAESAAAEIESALDAFDQIETKPSNYDQLARARDLIDHNDATCAGISAYDLAVQRYERTAEKEEQRQAAFARAVEEIEERHSRGQSAFRMLGNLKKQIRTNAEQTQYNELYDRDRTVESRGRAQREQSYTTELKALTDEFDAIESNTAAPLTEKALQLDKLLDKIGRLAENEKIGDGVSAPSINSRKALETKVTKTLESTRDAAAVDELTRALVTSVGDAAAYRAALASAKDKFGSESALGTALAAAQTDVGNVARADEWKAFVAAHGNANTWAWDKSTYERATEPLTGKSAALSFAPEFMNATEYANQLKTFANAGGYAGAIKALRNAFADYSRPLWVLHSADGEYYYVTSAPQDGSVKGLKYLMEPKGTPKDFNAVEFKSKTNPIPTLVAPQYALHELVKERLQDDYKSFETTLAAAFKTLDETDPEALDPALKLALVGKLSQCVANYPPLAAFGEWRRSVQDKPDVHFELNFMRPGKELRASRNAAITALREAPSLASAGSDARRATEEWGAALKREYRWVGFIDVVNGAPCVVFKEGEESANGRLYVARGEGAVAEECGESSSGVAKLTVGTDWTKARWTPVYLRVDVPK